VSEKNHAVAIRCLELLAKLRTSDFSRVILNRPVAPLYENSQSLDSMVSEELVLAGGGPDKFRELIRPLYLEARQGRQVLADALSVLRDGDYDLRYRIQDLERKSPVPRGDVRDLEEKWNGIFNKRSLSVALDKGLLRIDSAEYSGNVLTATREGLPQPKFPNDLNRLLSFDTHDRYRLMTISFFVASRLEQVISYSVQQWENDLKRKVDTIAEQMESGEIEQEPDSGN
jgi:hypothetical protein